MIGVALAVTAMIACHLSVGAMVLRLADRARGPRPLEEWLPLSFLLGWVAQGLLACASLLALGRLLPFAFPLLAAACAFAHLFLAPPSAPRLLQASVAARDAFSSARSLLVLVLLAAAATRLLVYLFAAWNFPLYTWDGRYIWHLKAMLLAHEPAIDTAAWLDPLRVHFHRDYPLLLPFAFAGIHELAADDSPRAPGLFLVALMACFVLYFHHALRARCGALVAAMGAFLAAGLGARMDYQVTDGMTLLTGAADIPLSFLAFALFHQTLSRWGSARPSSALIPGAFLAGCLMLKSEGVVVAAVWLAMVAALAARDRLTGRPLPWKPIVLSLIAALLVAAPWLVLKRGLPNFYDERFGELLALRGPGLLLERLGFVLHGIVVELLDDYRWGWFWPAYAVALVLSVPLARRALRSPLDWVVLAWGAAYLLAYLATPLDAVYHIESSLPRLLSHFQPLALFSLLSMVALAIRVARVRVALLSGSSGEAR